MGGSIIKDNVSITCTPMIGPARGWFEIVKVPTYDLGEVKGSNYDYIDDSSVRVIHLFNNTGLIRYLCQHKVVFNKWI